MKRLLPQSVLILILALCLADASAHEGEGRTDPLQSADHSASGDWLKARLSHGKEIYVRACASCHDPDAGEAPTIGRREEWSDRSTLWFAVLFEHARNGYLDMPAAGGHPELTGRDIDAAAEYMLSVTFPELPVD